jgi:hypothetical protein
MEQRTIQVEGGCRVLEVSAYRLRQIFDIVPYVEVDKRHGSVALWLYV